MYLLFTLLKSALQKKNVPTNDEDAVLRPQRNRPFTELWDLRTFPKIYNRSSAEHSAELRKSS